MSLRPVHAIKAGYRFRPGVKRRGGLLWTIVSLAQEAWLTGLERSRQPKIASSSDRFNESAYLWVRAR